MTTLSKNPNISRRKFKIKVDFTETLRRRTNKVAKLKSYKVQKGPNKNSVKNKTAKELLKSNFLEKFVCCIKDYEVPASAYFLTFSMLAILYSRL